MNLILRVSLSACQTEYDCECEWGIIVCVSSSTVVCVPLMEINKFSNFFSLCCSRFFFLL